MEKRQRTRASHPCPRGITAYLLKLEVQEELTVRASRSFFRSLHSFGQYLKCPFPPMVFRLNSISTSFKESEDTGEFLSITRDEYIVRETCNSIWVQTLHCTADPSETQNSSLMSTVRCCSRLKREGSRAVTLHGLSVSSRNTK